jgi:hypothetical protein
MSVPLCVLALGVFSPEAKANTISGLTGTTDVPDASCAGKWDGAIINICTNKSFDAYFDLGASTASPDHYYAHVFGGLYQNPITCWAESRHYDGSLLRAGPALRAQGSPHNQDFDLGTVDTANTHEVVCIMGPGSSVHAVDG